MLKVSGGNFDALDPSEISEQVWGVGEFKLNDCNSGSVILRGTDGEQQLSLTQLAGSVGLECGAD
jgi:hypothetical protein